MGRETARMEVCGLPGAQTRGTRGNHHLWRNLLRSPGPRAARRGFLGVLTIPRSQRRDRGSRHRITAGDAGLGLCCTASQPKMIGLGCAAQLHSHRPLRGSHPFSGCLWRDEGTVFFSTLLLCDGAGKLPAKCGGELGGWNEGVRGNVGGGGVDSPYPTHRDTAAMNGAPGSLNFRFSFLHLPPTEQFAHTIICASA